MSIHKGNTKLANYSPGLTANPQYIRGVKSFVDDIVAGGDVILGGKSLKGRLDALEYALEHMLGALAGETGLLAQEGNWDMQIRGSDLAGAYSLDISSLARYARVGRLVYLQAAATVNIAVNPDTSLPILGSGDLQITNLPFLPRGYDGEPSLLAGAAYITGIEGQIGVSVLRPIFTVPHQDPHLSFFTFDGSAGGSAGVTPVGVDVLGGLSKLSLSVTYVADLSGES